MNIYVKGISFCKNIALSSVLCVFMTFLFLVPKFACLGSRFLVLLALCLKLFLSGISLSFVSRILVSGCDGCMLEFCSLFKGIFSLFSFLLRVILSFLSRKGLGWIETFVISLLGFGRFRGLLVEKCVSVFRDERGEGLVYGY